MADDRRIIDSTSGDDGLDQSTSPVSASPSTPGSAETGDPADQIPVPPAMSAAEIDERAQAVEAVRGRSTSSTDDEARMDA